MVKAQVTSVPHNAVPVPSTDIRLYGLEPNSSLVSVNMLQNQPTG